MPKMPIPANQVVNPQKMELTFPFGGTTKHELQIVDSTGAVIVPETIIDRGPTGGSGGIGGEVTINLIGLPHEGPYLAGKYKLTQKGLALKKNDEDSDTATMEFEMSSELAALANSRLAMKAFVGMEAKLQLLEADHGEKLKHFPDLKKSIEKLEALLAGGKADLTEVKNLNAQIKIALASIGTLKNEFAAALHELQEALKKVTAAKVAPAKKTAKKPSATSGGGSNTPVSTSTSVVESTAAIAAPRIRPPPVTNSDSPQTNPPSCRRRASRARRNRVRAARPRARR